MHPSKNLGLRKGMTSPTRNFRMMQKIIFSSVYFAFVHCTVIDRRARERNENEKPDQCSQQQDNAHFGYVSWHRWGLGLAISVGNGVSTFRSAPHSRHNIRHPASLAYSRALGVFTTWNVALVWATYPIPLPTSFFIASRVRAAVSSLHSLSSNRRAAAHY